MTMSDTFDPRAAGRRRGRPPCCTRQLMMEIITLRRQGLSFNGIAANLNERSIPMPQGRGHWYKSAVERLLKTQHARAIEAEMDQG